LTILTLYRYNGFEGIKITGGTSMEIFWFVCDGEVEKYSGQEVNWCNSFIVFAQLPEDALLKVMKYHLGKLRRCGAVYGSKDIEVIS
jgi:hypothetical protein